MPKRLAIALVAIAAPLVAPSFAGADTVTQWNLNATNALMITAAQPPQQSVPHMAMVQGAVYDAVNAIDGGYEGYLITRRLTAPFASKDAAAATAAHDVLVHLVPAQQASLDALYALSLMTVPDGWAKTRGIAVGGAAAAAMIAARLDDGRFGPYRFPVGSGPGEWRPVLPAFVNDPNAWLKDVKPFLVESGSQFASKGPRPLKSPLYAREFNEVKELGEATSTERTADQTLSARYWGENPPNTWSRVARKLAMQEGLSPIENARLFAILYMTAADSLITVWTDKARFLFWRPITAIEEADTDGNPLTEKQVGWRPLIPTPPYTEHPSGLAALSSAFVATFQDVFGTDDVAWTDTNNGGLTRSFSRLSQAIDEVVDARVWSGIHFRSADEQSAKIGRQVAKWREKHYFEPLHGQH